MKVDCGKTTSIGRHIAGLVCTALFLLHTMPLWASSIGVFVSVAPQKYFVRKIGGTLVNVSILVPAGADPHTYEPKPRQMVELAKNFRAADGVLKRALNQAARELLLAQSSDWAFILKTGSHVEYAVKRTKDHVLRFTRLYDDIKGNHIDEGWLRTIEYQDNIFPDIDYGVYA